MHWWGNLSTSGNAHIYRDRGVVSARSTAMRLACRSWSVARFTDGGVRGARNRRTDALDGRHRGPARCERSGHGPPGRS